MASKLDKRQLRSLTLRVAGSWLKVAFSMDEFARLSMLEGLAAQPPGTWVKKGRRGMGMAMEHFPMAHPNWTSPRDTGVYRPVLGFATQFLKSSPVSGMDAGEFINEFNTHSTQSTGPDYKRMFWAVGDSNRKNGRDKEVASGQLSPNHSMFGGLLVKNLKQKLINYVKQQKKNPETSFAMQPGEDQYDPFSGHGTQEFTEEDTKRLLIMAMRSKTPIGRNIRQIIDSMIDQEWRIPQEAQIVHMFMAKMMDPKWNVPHPKVQGGNNWRPTKGDNRPRAEAWYDAVAKRIGGEIAEELGIKRGPVSKALGGASRRVLKFMAKVGEKANIEALLAKFADDIVGLSAGPGLNMASLKNQQLRSMALRVASTWLKVAFSMDEFARLSMLEGFAGERPGKWSGKGRRGMGMAQEKYPQMHPNWTSPRDTGVYRAAVGTVDKVLKSSRVSGMDAEEVLQELNSNAGTSSGPSYKRIFYTVGQTNAKYGRDKDLAAGKLAPNNSLIGGTLHSFLKQKALNAIKMKHEQMETSFAMQPGEGQYDPFRGHGTVELTDEDTKRLLIMAMRSNTSIGRSVRNFIEGMIDQEWRNPKDAEIVRVFMAKMMDPRWSSPPKDWRQKKGDPRSGADAWFAAAVKKIGGEIASELDVRRQDVSKALGGGASRVLKFMEKVGEKANIDALLEKFADEIEYLAAGPGLNISADHHETPVIPALTEKQTPVNPTNVLKMWLEKKKQETQQQVDEEPTNENNNLMGCGCDEDEMASRVASLWLEKTQ